MRLLFICTAHNSLSQRLALRLTDLGHAVTVELALSPELMISAAELAQPDVIICPFLTKRVPKEVYTKWMTLIVHPGPPGDAGPSSLDLALMGDCGTLASWDEQLSLIDFRHGQSSDPTKAPTSLQDLGRRSHWGVTVLQAIEQLDAGPIWAFSTFPLAETHSATLSKSELYRGPVTNSAISAVLCALERLSLAHAASLEGLEGGISSLSPSLFPPQSASKLCVDSSKPFQGGKTHERPLLKASQRDFVGILPGKRAAASLHLSSGFSPRPVLNANVIVQRINSGDSQPGVLSCLFGTPLFLYGAKVQTSPLPPDLAAKLEASILEDSVGQILATRQDAVLVNCGADLPIWIECIRKPKAKADKYLSVKLPAQLGIKGIESLKEKLEAVEEWDDEDGSWKKQDGTYQQVWIEWEDTQKGEKVAYVYFEFYNGATSTTQSELLSSAITHALAQPKIAALVMMGGAGYFSNGIALNVIEGHEDPAAESWANINAIDDVVRSLLCPSGVLTFAALRGNAAAGGLALATCCDIVLCSKIAVLNPHYRALGLTGSEYHSWSWPARCGTSVASTFMKGMLPMSSEEGLRIGLVDSLIGNHESSPKALENEVRESVRAIMNAQKGEKLKNGLETASARWTNALVPNSQDQILSHAEQLLANKEAFLNYHFTSMLQVLPINKKQKRMTISIDFDVEFEKFRAKELEGMRLDFFHVSSQGSSWTRCTQPFTDPSSNLLSHLPLSQPVRSERYSSRRIAFVRKLVPNATPLRFALHRRYGSNWVEASKREHSSTDDAIIKPDDEELDSFDSIGDVPDSAAIVRMPVRESKISILSALSIHRDSMPESMSRSDSGNSIPTLSVSHSNSQSLSRPSTAATSPAVSRPASLSEYKNRTALPLEQEYNEEIERLEAPTATLVPVYPSPRASTITFAPQTPKASQLQNVHLKSGKHDSTSPIKKEKSGSPLKKDVSNRFSRIKSSSTLSWFRKDSTEDSGKKSSRTQKFLESISKRSKAFVNKLPSSSKEANRESTTPESHPQTLQRRRSMTEVPSATIKEASSFSRHSLGDALGPKSQTTGRCNPRNKRPSTAGASPEHAFACYYAETEVPTKSTLQRTSKPAAVESSN